MHTISCFRKTIIPSCPTLIYIVTSNKNAPTLKSLTVADILYSSSRSLFDAINSPPLLIHPGLTPVSSSSDAIRFRLMVNNSWSTSLGRNRQTRPTDRHSAHLKAGALGRGLAFCQNWAICGKFGVTWVGKQGSDIHFCSQPMVAAIDKFDYILVLVSDDCHPPDHRVILLT